MNVLSCGRRFGKTLLGVDLAIEAALDGYPVGWFVPEYKLLTEAWRDMVELLGPLGRPNRQERRIELLTGGVIEAWSFDRNPNAGRSRRYKRIIIDEAAHTPSLRDTWTQCLRPTLTDFKGDAWFLSSPAGKGYFYTLWQRGLAASGEWKSWQMPSHANPHLDPAEIDAARADLGDLFFDQEYLARFLDSLLGSVLPGEWLDRAAAATHLRAGPLRMSVDIGEGGAGGDPSGVLVRDDNGVQAAEIGRWSIGATASKAAMMAERWKVATHRIVFDAGGVGADFANRLDALGLVGSTPYKGGESGGADFKNLRTAAAWAARRRLDPGRALVESPAVDLASGPRASPFPAVIYPGQSAPARPKGPAARALPPFAIPRDVMDAARAELVALRYTIEGDRRKALEPKAEMAAALGRSPTYADLLIMSFAYPDD